MEIEECRDIMLKYAAKITETQTVSIDAAAGRISARDIYSPMMVPPFPKSAMDGYAVKSCDVINASKENPAVLKVDGELCAGDYADYRYEAGHAVRIMTGAYVPCGYDAVVRQEDTDYGEENVSVYKGVSSYTNYCREGEDIQKGQLIIKAGTYIKPVHVGLLAETGIQEVEVVRPLKAALISTGSELCETGEPLSDGKIYNSIKHILSAAIRNAGFTVTEAILCEDDEDRLIARIDEAVSEADIVITTGAVSVGKKDIIPSVTEKLGAVLLFRRARIQPGTPTMASLYKDKILLNLSGNPYAALANFELYFWPYAAKVMGSTAYEPLTGYAVLDCEYNKVNKTRRLVRAYAEGGRVIIPSDVHASSVISNLTECNCFMDVEEGASLKKGDMVRVIYFKEF